MTVSIDSLRPSMTNSRPGIRRSAQYVDAESPRVPAMPPGHLAPSPEYPNVHQIRKQRKHSRGVYGGRKTRTSPRAASMVL